MDVSSANLSCDFVLFGALGDLARKKLIPSLYKLEQKNLLGSSVRIVGVARQSISLHEYTVLIKEMLEYAVELPLCSSTLNRFIARFEYGVLDFMQTDAYSILKVFLNTKHPQIYYLATPPAVYRDICQGLSNAHLIDQTSRVVLEKPIGSCFQSSQVINDHVAHFFQEKQIYRIDHYLGKETVQNLIALRFSNALFVSNWDASTIDHVQVTVAEEVGIAGRWDYFNTTGQMRDMVQNHLLQILSLVAMEPPTHLDADSIRDEKVKVLKSLRPITQDSIFENTVRGQYDQGFIQEQAVQGYFDEDGADPESETETFVALRIYIDNWRWAGVPFYLRSGKRMPNKTSEIVIYFKNPPHSLYGEQYKQTLSNKLTIRLQPDEGVDIQVLNKVPGVNSQARLQTTKLDLSFNDTFNTEVISDAYERLILATMTGDQSLFVRRDEVEAAWKWVDSVMLAWQATGDKPRLYPAGSWGPVASSTLISQDGRSWDES
tara:strand:- start:2232 stop:3701 length:1470 start_codon:yes stop_codon:yes gene_type:complete